MLGPFLVPKGGGKPPTPTSWLGRGPGWVLGAVSVLEVPSLQPAH